LVGYAEGNRVLMKEEFPDVYSVRVFDKRGYANSFKRYDKLDLLLVQEIKKNKKA